MKDRRVLYALVLLLSLCYCRAIRSSFCRAKRTEAEIGNAMINITFSASDPSSITYLFQKSSDNGLPTLVFGPSTLPCLGVEGKGLSWKAESLVCTARGSSAVLYVTIRTVDASYLRQTFVVEVPPDLPFMRMNSNASLHCNNKDADQCRYLITYAELLKMSWHVNPPTPYMQVFHVEQWNWVDQTTHFKQKVLGIIPGRYEQTFMMGSFGSFWPGETSCGWFAVQPTDVWKSPSSISSYSPPTGPRRPDDTYPPGVVVGIEFSGKSTYHSVNNGLDGFAHVWVTINNLNHSITPTESFDVPGVFVGLFQGDWDEAGWVTHQFAEQYVYPPLPSDDYPFAQYDSWQYGLNINETNQMEAMIVAAKLGLEVFVLDLGWATQIGEWIADPVKFPHGLASLVTKAHSLGLRFGLHLPIAQAMMSAPIVQENPNFPTLWGDYDYQGAGALCLGHTPCRGTVISAIKDMIDRYDIDYIVQDGEDMVKSCAKSNHTHNLGDSNYANSQSGLDQVLISIRQHKPDIILENCADGGTDLTYRMASLYTTSISIDNSPIYVTRQGVYGMSYPFSPRFSSRYLEDRINTTYTCHSVIFGGPLIIQLRIGEWSATEIETGRRCVALYKKYRKQIRSGKVYHLLAPLGEQLLSDGWGWDAIQSVSSSKQQSILFVYRAQGGGDTTTVYPAGLRSSTLYKVHFVSTNTTISASGRTIQDQGLALPLLQYSSEIIEIAS